MLTTHQSPASPLSAEGQEHLEFMLRDEKQRNLQFSGLYSSEELKANALIDVMEHELRAVMYAFRRRENSTALRILEAIGLFVSNKSDEFSASVDNQRLVSLVHLYDTAVLTITKRLASRNKLTKAHFPNLEILDQILRQPHKIIQRMVEQGSLLYFNERLDVIMGRRVLDEARIQNQEEELVDFIEAFELYNQLYHKDTNDSRYSLSELGDDRTHHMDSSDNDYEDLNNDFELMAQIPGLSPKKRIAVVNEIYDKLEEHGVSVEDEPMGSMSVVSGEFSEMTSNDEL